MAGKCPKCGANVSAARLESMDVSDGQRTIAAFSAACPHCSTIMGVIVDPRLSDSNLLDILDQVKRLR